MFIMSDVDLNEAEIHGDRQSDNNEGNSQEEVIDPRVQVELERLNTSTDLINKLEIELDEARSSFRVLLNDSSIRINQLAKKLGSCVEKAKPYYEARMKAKQLQTQTQKAALRYERASSAHSAAKEMVYIAEEGLKQEGRCFDPAWQEMLNHATLRVNEAESERVLSQHEHQKVSSAYNEAEKIVQKLHQDLKKSIVKSSLSSRRSLLQLNNLANQHQLQLLPYFEMKAQFNLLLEEQRKKVHLLEENVLKVKMSYADALHNLEEISDEIHRKRKSKDQLIEDDSENVAPIKNQRWNNLDIYNKLSSSNASNEDVYNDDLNSDEIYKSLPSKLKMRSGIVHTTWPGMDSEVANSQTIPAEASEASVSHNIECNPVVTQGINSNGTSLHSYDCTEHEQKNWNHQTFNSPSISNQVENVNLSNHGSDDLGGSLSNSREKFSHPEDSKFLAPDFNILRVQREEISDSESLASNDTVDTLDDNQIECLFLDKALPLDVDSVLL